ncbi:Zn-dependent exopeptidase [Irpex rosettiformis]|uniref:Zn-dependent exopeptidase n=1 Tax=Irpex rosettiformis TaxID=378272 RepID=A0ACB8U292_9APHY|nr:Zn-dependent exopeptidase [Irpex rosettiformis]
MTDNVSPTIPNPLLRILTVDQATLGTASSLEEHPMLFHSLQQEKSSVLALSADENYIYSGSQGHDISVWDKRTFTLKTTLRGHTASVLALEYAPDRQWLFSVSGDSTIRIWSAKTLEPVFVLNPYMETDSGDIFCVNWNSATSTVYFGCQNTSIQWFSFKSVLELATSAFEAGFSDSRGVRSSSLERVLSENGLHSGTVTPRRAHKFFDSYPQYQRKPADLNARNPCCSSSRPPSPYLGSPTPSVSSSYDSCVITSNIQNLRTPQVLSVPPENMIWSAHYGYVYCMALAPSSNREGSDDPPVGRNTNMQLITGSGDATVKVWSLTSGAPELQHTFECEQGAVLSVAVRNDIIYAGCQDGYVKVWDLETKTLLRRIIVSENVDILSLSILHSDLYTCSANGQVQRWSAGFNMTASWQAHPGIILSSIVTRLKEDTLDPAKSERFVLVTGGNDDQINIWEVSPPKPAPHLEREFKKLDLNGEIDLSKDTMVYALSKFVSIPSISSAVHHKEDCRQAAVWLRKCLIQLGAQAQLLPTSEAHNPIVFATFFGKQTERKKQRILFYGHYDVVSAPSSIWDTDPFTLTACNGYLYGRGVTDNKGPVMAVACAAAELLGNRALDLDLVFLIEGEEEAGSGGFEESVRRHKDLIGPIDAILVSNSTWIAEDTPCITYGLRGVVHCKVQVSGQGPDLHSGVDGGAVAEPMVDMVQLLGTLFDKDRHVALPSFYSSVRPLTDEERQMYKVLSGVIQTPATSLSAKWREPSLTVHDIKTSSATNATVIPASVTARVSIRIVPDQDLDTIAKSIQDYLRDEFAKMKSPNTLEVSITRTADWWLGNLDDFWFKALEDAVRDEWGLEPLRIREGGSIPSVPYLEKEFSCHALHLPLGQSTDQAHLPNERISLSNLRRGKSVVERFLVKVSENSSS